jgi:hypothetical protein
MQRINQAIKPCVRNCAKINNVGFSINYFSFQQQIINKKNVSNSSKDSPFHLHKNNSRKSAHHKPMLCRYLEEKNINKNIADKYCYEV